MSIQVEIQYFIGCPDSKELLSRVQSAVQKINYDVDYREVLVETPEAATRYKFRGSPTLLIDGEDYEGMLAPENANLFCRIYANGIPSEDEIVSKLQSFQP